MRISIVAVLFAVSACSGEYVDGGGEYYADGVGGAVTAGEPAAAAEPVDLIEPAEGSGGAVAVAADELIVEMGGAPPVDALHTGGAHDEPVASAGGAAVEVATGGTQSSEPSSGGASSGGAHQSSGGADDGYNPSEHYIDRDGDGYGSGDPMMMEPRAGFVDNSDDCNDSDPEVHPGADEFSYSPDDSGSFDRNCDGAEEFELTSVQDCTVDEGGPEGWLGIEPPPCGVISQWGKCVGGQVEAIQRCR